MTFERKKTMLLASSISSFISAILVAVLGICILIFPDLLIALFNNDQTWAEILINTRKFVIIWVFISVGVQVTCGFFFVCQYAKTEEQFKKITWMYYLSIACTAVFGTVVTLAILMISIFCGIAPKYESIITEKESKIQNLKELKENGTLTNEEYLQEAEKVI